MVKIYRTPQSKILATPMLYQQGNSYIWYSLSDYVVSSDTVNTFKHRLDKYWFDQDVKCNYKADLSGIGNCSNVI